jgi:hypothetical protein
VIKNIARLDTAAAKTDADLNKLTDELHKSVLQQNTPIDEPAIPVFVLLQVFEHRRIQAPADNSCAPDFLKIFN